MIKCSKAEVRRLTALHWKLPPAQRERIQMVLWREIGMTQPAIAEGMGVSLSTVNRAHMAYDQGGIKALKPKPNGGRKRENMSLAEEKAFLARFATAAGAGEMLNIHDLKAAYEQAIAHQTSDSTIYNLLHRHDWRKLMPRSHRISIYFSYILRPPLEGRARHSQECFFPPRRGFNLRCTRERDIPKNVFFLRDEVLIYDAPV